MMIARKWILVVAVSVLSAYAAGAQTAEQMRDPFWPIGFAPIGSGISAVNLDDDTSPLQFNEFSPEEQAMIRRNTTVTGILKQRSGHYAIINNQVVRPGDTLTIKLSIKEYRFYVRNITTERVVLDYIRPDEQRDDSQGSEVDNRK